MRQNARVPSAAVETPATSAADPTAAGGRIRSLDGIRAIAVIVVLAFHADIPWIHGGFLGVDLFFVLSGFLITGILLRSGQLAGGPGGLREFWLRRARRLFPALFLVVLAVVVVRLLLSDPATANSWRVDIQAAVLYATNWLQVWRSSDYFAQFQELSPLLQTWSLSIEEQYYLVFPLVLALLLAWRVRGRGLVWVLGSLALGSAAWMVLLDLTGADDGRLYFGTDTRAQSLLVGAALGAAIRIPAAYRPGVRAQRWAGPAGAVGLVVFLLLATVISDTTPALYRGGFLLSACAGAALIWGALGDNRLSRALSTGPLVAIGTISYGVYLWHWPVFLAIRPQETEHSWISVLVVRLLITFGLAYVSYRFVEKPLRSGPFARWPVRRQWLVAAAAGAVLVVLAAIPAPRAAQVANAFAAGWPDASKLPTSIFVGGDSTAFSLNKEFPKQRYPGISLSAANEIGCGLAPAKFFQNGVPVDVEATRCAGWEQRWAPNAAAGGPGAAFVVLGVWDLFDRDIGGQARGPGTPEYAASLDEALGRAVDIAGRDGAVPVRVVGFPCYSAVIDKEVLNDNQRIARANEVVKEFVRTHSRDAEYVDMAAITCLPNGAVQEVDGAQLRSDGVHWTPAGAEYVWRYLLNGLASKT